MKFKLTPYSHRAWLIEFSSDGFSKLLCQNILHLADVFRKSNHLWSEIVPAYDSLLLKLRPNIVRAEAEVIIRHILDDFKPSKTLTCADNITEIPVIYGGNYGPDLMHVAQEKRLSLDQVITLHSQNPYMICLMGFIPGFAFMSDTNSKLHIPRREQPRTIVPAGSVGLAGWQTGIYGLDSPGGWQIIGQTQLTLFDPDRDPPFLLKAGDWVRFVPQTTWS
ncbi:MAG: 5-oxoprolinase subunit PxpB [Maricaulaceae bacterium]